MAASSLRVASDELAEAYEQQSGLTVRFNLGGSQALAAQIVGGASGDLLLTANQISIEAGGKRVDAIQTFVSNELVILVATGNPKQIKDLDDLANRDLVVVIADPSVPVGAYTQTALIEAGVSLKPVSLEPSVSGVATRIATGDADAGLGYRTDALSNPDLDAVELGSGIIVRAQYFASTIDSSDKGSTFLEWLNDGEGALILAAAGFTP